VPRELLAVSIKQRRRSERSCRSRFIDVHRTDTVLDASTARAVELGACRGHRDLNSFAFELTTAHNP
jgi:hypothetical protein